MLQFDANTTSSLQFLCTRRIRVVHGSIVLLLQADDAAATQEWALALRRALIARAQEASADSPLALIAQAQGSSAEPPPGGWNQPMQTARLPPPLAQQAIVVGLRPGCEGIEAGSSSSSHAAGEENGSGSGSGSGSGVRSRLSGILPAAWRLASVSVRRVSDRLRPTETCALCCEKVAQRSIHANAGCGHRCCESCWQRYLAVDVSAARARMRHARAYTLRCPWAPGCDCPLDKELLGKFGQRPLVHTAAAVAYREQLVERAGAIGCRWLECPQAGCVGVGYDDGVQETAMCFACQHQFEVSPRGVVHVVGNAIYSWLLSWWPERIDGVSGWRPCPHCGAAILKDGGCDNMRCGMCQRTFKWGMLRNSIDGAVEAHAPPPRAQVARARAASWTM